MDDIKSEVESTLDAGSMALVTSDMRFEIIRDLGPVASRIDSYAKRAASITVANENDAATAVQVCNDIAEDVKLVKNHATLSAVITGFHSFHKRLVGLRDAFVTPLEQSRLSIKGKVMSWQQAEQAKAQAEQRRLQAIADEAARKERERLEKKAQSYKTEEKRDAALEQAAQVIAPVISVEAPKVGMRSRTDVVVEILDIVAFVKDASVRVDLCGYIDQDKLKAALKKAKTSNKMFSCAGVSFSERIV